jgi:hypothetical protein
MTKRQNLQDISSGRVPRRVSVEPKFENKIQFQSSMIFYFANHLHRKFH